MVGAVAGVPEETAPTGPGLAGAEVGLGTGVCVAGGSEGIVFVGVGASCAGGPTVCGAPHPAVASAAAVAIRNSKLANSILALISATTYV